MMILASKDFLPGKLWSLIYYTQDSVFVIFQSNDRSEVIGEKVRQLAQTSFSKFVKLEEYFFEYLKGYYDVDSKDANEWVSCLESDLKFLEIWKGFIQEYRVFFAKPEDHVAFSNMMLGSDLEIVRTRSIMALAEKIQLE